MAATYLQRSRSYIRIIAETPGSIVLGVNTDGIAGSIDKGNIQQYGNRRETRGLVRPVRRGLLATCLLNVLRVLLQTAVCTRTRRILLYDSSKQSPYIIMEL